MQSVENSNENICTSAVGFSSTDCSGGGASPSKKKYNVKPFCRSKAKATFKLNLEYIEELSLEQKKVIAFVLKIKQQFANSRIYDYSPKTLSKKIGVSEYNIKKYVGCLIKNNQAYFAGNDVVIKSLDSIIEKNRYRSKSVLIFKDYSIKDIVSVIDLILIKREVNKQKFVRSLKCDERITSGAFTAPHQHYMTNKKYDRVRDYRKNNPQLLRGAYEKDEFIGVRKLASILNVSQATASKVLKHLEHLKLIKTERKVMVCSGVFMNTFVTSEQLNDAIGGVGYYYREGNNLMLDKGTKITLVKKSDNFYR